MLLSEAQALVVSKFVTLTPVDETDEAQDLVGFKTVTLVPVDETDEAQAFTETNYRDLIPVDELDEALELLTESTPLVSIGAPSTPIPRKRKKRKKRKEPIPLDLPPIDVWLEEMGVVVLHIEEEDDLVLLDLLF